MAESQSPKEEDRIETGPIASPSAVRSPSAGSTLAWLLAIVAVGLVVRALIYFRVENVLHADEALQGLMARHILGGELQLFTYGSPVLGTLQAHWIAACSAVLGSSSAVLKWAAGFESLVLILAVFLLGREIAGGDRRAGFVAALLVAAGPLYLIEWSMRPRGGHLEAATFSALAFWTLLRALRPARTAVAGNEVSKASIAWLAFSGFLLGVGFWVHPSVFFALAAIVIGLSLWGGALRRSPAAWIGFFALFFMGSLPFWLFNVKYPGRTFLFFVETIRNGGLFRAFPQRLGLTISQSLPIVFGSRQTMAAESFGRVLVGLSWIPYILTLVAAFGLAGRRDRPAAESTGASSGFSPVGVRLVLLFAAVVLVVFVAGPFRRFHGDPVVLLPLYGVLAPLMAAAAMRWWDAGGPRRALVGIAAGVVVVVHLAGYRMAERDVVQPRIRGVVVPADLGALKGLLAREGIEHVYTNYFIGYRLAFETAERVIAATDRYPRPEPHTVYLDKVKATSEPIALVVDPRLADWVRADLTQRDIDFEEIDIHGFRLFYSLKGRYTDFPPGPELCLPAVLKVGAYKNQCQPGERFSCEVTVTNRSKLIWPAKPSWREVRLAYHIYSPETGRSVRFETPRTDLGQALGPGESTTATLSIEAPETPGRYAFAPDLVIEDAAWFSWIDPSIVDRANWHEFVAAE